MNMLKVPEGVSSVAHGDHSFTADADGFIDTKGAPSGVITHLIQFAGCREPTPDDLKRADDNIVNEHIQETVQDEKARLRAQLDQLGIAYDGRATIRGLRRLLEEATHPAPAQKADPDPAPASGPETKQPQAGPEAAQEAESDKA